MFIWDLQISTLYQILDNLKKMPADPGMRSRESELKMLKFDSYSEEWLDFILNCRSGKDSTDYDLVVGGVANDKVFNTVELFFDGLIDKTEAINRLRYEKPNLQISFRTEKALSLLHFEGSETL